MAEADEGADGQRPGSGASPTRRGRYARSERAGPARPTCSLGSAASLLPSGLIRALQATGTTTGATGPRPRPRGARTRGAAGLALLLAACSHGPIDVRDAEELARVLPADAALELVATDLGFVEGPVWMGAGTNEGGGSLVFSDVRGGRLLTWSEAGGVQTYRSPVPGPNGCALDREGRLVVCEQEGRRVTRLEPGGALTVLADRFRGRRLNSPNDVVVAADGAVWFTDPPLGIPRGQIQELEGAYVFRLAPPRAVGEEPAERAEPSVSVADGDAPNGLCFAPGGDVLYVADSGERGDVRAFDVGPDGALSGGRVLYVSATGHPDGLRCDADGRLWIATADGIHVVLPSGRLIARILSPEPARNLCFGGEDGRSLFVTAGSSLYVLHSSVSGA